MSLSKSTLSNVEPGTSGTLSIQITESRKWTGNYGIRYFTGVPHWMASLIRSIHCYLGSSQSSNNRETVTVDIFVPEDASAESDTVISFSVGREEGRLLRLKGSNRIQSHLDTRSLHLWFRTNKLEDLIR